MSRPARQEKLVAPVAETPGCSPVISIQRRGRDLLGHVRPLNLIYELSGSNGRLRPMEGLRGLAVLMVFFVHLDALFGVYARHSTLLSRPLHFLGIVGNAGVDLFFVLSGYLIYGALMRHTVGFIDFLRRRAERIYPTF